MGRSRLAPWVGAIFLLFVSGAWVLADQLSGAGGTYWSGTLVARQTAACVSEATDAGASPCVLFPSGTDPANFWKVVVVVSDSAVRCGFAGLPQIDMTGTTTSAGLTWADTQPGGYGTGGGVINRLDPDLGTARWDIRPERDPHLLAQSGGALGLCSVAITTGRDTLFAPCRLDANCAAPYGGGTCRTGDNITDAQKRQAGAFLICEAPSGTIANVDIKKDKVLNK